MPGKKFTAFTTLVNAAVSGFKQRNSACRLFEGAQKSERR
jgi:hypothetical protein